MRYKYYLTALGIVALDYITKLIARSDLDYNRVVEIIPGYLRLSYVQNSGVAFGILDSLQSGWKPYVLAAMAVIAIAAIIFYSLRTRPDRKLLQWALAVTMGGISGNFLDRIFRGYVIDFIEFHIRERFYWPNFNIADSAITIGIALLLMDAIIHPAMENVAKQVAATDKANE